MMAKKPMITQRPSRRNPPEVLPVEGFDLTGGAAYYGPID